MRATAPIASSKGRRREFEGAATGFTFSPETAVSMGVPTIVPVGTNMPSGKNVSTGIFSLLDIHRTQELDGTSCEAPPRGRHRLCPRRGDTGAHRYCGSEDVWRARVRSC